MKQTMISLALSGLIFSIISTQAHAVEIKLPGISINEEGVRVGDVSITESEVVIKEGSANSSDEIGRKISNADHSRSNYEGNNLDGAIISTSNFSRSNLNVANMRGANISGSNFGRASLIQVDLQGARISNSDFSRAKLGQVILADARIKGTDLSRANFDGTDLSGVVFENSDLSRASFKGACLYGAKFINSNFSRANFTGAVLTNTYNDNSEFSRATLERVDRTSSCGRSNGDNATLESESSSRVVDFDRVEIATAEAILVALSTGEDSKIDLTVNFDFNSDQVQGNARAQISEIAAALSDEALSNSAILIEGHTDSTGDADYNQKLSYRRALRVMDILVERYRIDGDRLSIKGMGEAFPVADNGSGAGRALNRRVTLVNAGER